VDDKGSGEKCVKSLWSGLVGGRLGVESMLSLINQDWECDKVTSDTDVVRGTLLYNTSGDPTQLAEIS
jgi:hypothetical protein